MQQIFYEESAVSKNKLGEKTKYNILRFFQIASYVAIAIWSIVVYFSFNFGGSWVILAIVFFIPNAIFILFSIILGKFKKNFCIDYDYTIAGNSIRVSKVINDNKRYSIYVFDSTKISMIGNFNSSGYLRLNNDPTMVTEFLTTNVSPNEGKHFYYLFVPELNGQNRLLVFECTGTFIKNLSKVVNKTIIENGFNVL